jgi:NADPH:quinone reductase
MKAIQITEFGGPEQMELVELPDPEAGPGEVVVDVARAGVNFADTHAIRDDYLAKQALPLIPGGEVAGLDPSGRRVAAMLTSGGYAQRVAVHEAALVPIPDEVSDDQAAGLLLQGLTALTLLRTSAKLEEGETVLIQAAAGGTGSLAVQLAKRLGAGRVIGMASSEGKRDLVRRLGADEAIDSRAEDLKTAILEANGGEPVDVVLEMSGGPAFDACLSALAPFGRLVSFGIASGITNEVRNADLMRASRSVVGFWLVHLFRKPELLRSGIAELLELTASGELEIVIGGVYPLAEARRVHEDLRARTTEGKLLLDTGEVES